VELAVLENVGNLVCPAEFDTRRGEKRSILSVPEGDDKPLKYPLMFQICNVVLINKTDVCCPTLILTWRKCRENIPHAQPERQGHPHLRQDKRGRGRMGRLAARPK
jgi:hydrogenase nickel incorporation protein HypB